MHRILYNANRVAYIDTPLYHYTHNNKGIMRGEFTLARLDILYAINDRIAFSERINLKRYAELNTLRYCWHVFDLSRHFQNDQKTLLFLQAKLQEKLPKLLTFDWLSDEIKSQICLLEKNPFQGELFDCWAAAIAAGFSHA